MKLRSHDFRVFVIDSKPPLVKAWADIYPIKVIFELGGPHPD